MKHKRNLLLFGMAFAMISTVVSSFFLSPHAYADLNGLSDAQVALCKQWSDNTLTINQPTTKRDSSGGWDLGGNIGTKDSDSNVAQRCISQGKCKDLTTANHLPGGELEFHCDFATTAPTGNTGIPSPPKIQTELKPLITLICGPMSGQQKTDCTAVVANVWYDHNCQANLPDKEDAYTDCIYKSLGLDWVTMKNAYPSVRALPSEAQIKQYAKKGLDQANKEATANAQAAAKSACANDDTKIWQDGQCIDKPPTTTCAVEGIGWIVCPVMNFMAKLNDAAFGVLNNFLGVSSKLTASSGLKNGWEIFRNIANICFVIAFLVIIYSQLTGAGITNYGIKRLLPKLIIAAILVNASIYVCQIAVDISNIAGSSVYDLLKGLGKGQVSSTGAGGELWANAIGAILAVVAGALLLVAIILAPTSLIALGAAVIVLTARQAIIVLLIVVSPLAFVAYLLPNTESWFKRWWKMFSTMLMLYPVVGLVFGASTLAADILYSVGKTSDDKSMMLMALGVMAVPLFAVPTLLKGALAAAGSIGNQVAKLQGKANSFAGKGAKATLKRHGESLEARMAGSNNRFARFTGGYRNRRAFGRKSMETETVRQQEAALSSHVRNNPQKYSTQQQAIAYQAVDKAWDENVKAHQALYSSKGFDENQLLEDMNDSRLSHEQRAAAAGIVAEKGSRKAQLQALRHASALHRSGDEAAEGIQKQMSAQMGSRRPFGLSDSEAAALRTGKYEGNIDADTATRATEKLAPAGIPDLDPDDLTLIKKKVEDGTISGTELNELRTSIGSAYTDPRVSQRIKPQARADLDVILAHGGTESSQTTTP